MGSPSVMETWKLYLHLLVVHARFETTGVSQRFLYGNIATRIEPMKTWSPRFVSRHARHLYHKWHHAPWECSAVQRYTSLHVRCNRTFGLWLLRMADSRLSQDATHITYYHIVFTYLSKLAIIWSPHKSIVHVHSGTLVYRSCKNQLLSCIHWALAFKTGWVLRIFYFEVAERLTWLSTKDHVTTPKIGSV